MNLPNKLSIIRIIFVPIIIIIDLFPYHLINYVFPLYTFSGISISLKYIIILILFIISSITDFLDGHIARKNNIITAFGQFIDPVADKALINSVLILLAYDRMIPILPVVIMILRDVVVDGCRMIAASKGIIVAANFYGKLKTVTQIFAICLSLLNNFPFEIWDLQVSLLLIWFTTFVSVYSGIHYFNQIRDEIFESF